MGHKCVALRHKKKKKKEQVYMPRNTMSSVLMLSLLLLLLPILFTPSEAKDCGISVYWGTDGSENSLNLICAAPNPVYKYISIGFLETFGSGKDPVLSIGGKVCSPSSGNCKNLASGIKLCQKKGIKVLLSLGGPSGNYGLSSQQDAEQFASDLFYNYLAAGSEGPLGDVVLDGVDLAIQNPGSQKNWDSLVIAIAGFTKPNGDSLFISAAPGCSYPDPNLDAAIQTGFIDYLWVKFYDDDQCDMSVLGVRGILDAWNKWKANIPAKTKLFMGLPANSDAATTGYVEATTLVNQILPSIRKFPKYGGINVWNYYYDDKAKYSAAVSAQVCKGVVTNNRTFISQVV